MNSANNILEAFIPLNFFFFRPHFNSDDSGDGSLAAESEAVQRVRTIVEDADRPRKSCVSTAVSSRLDLGPRASDDTRNNDRSSWQLPSRRLVTQPPTQPSLSAELSFSSRTPEPVVQPRNWLEYYTTLITKVRPSRPPLIADRSPPSFASLVHRRRSSRAVLVSGHEEAPRDTPRKLGLHGFSLFLSGRTLWPSWGCFARTVTRASGREPMGLCFAY